MRMDRANRRKRVIQGAASLGLLLLGLFWAEHHSYVLFHSLAELFSVVVGAGIFMVSWNARRLQQDDYLTFLGIGFLFVAGLDLVHTLAYKGMPVFPEYDSDLATQLWIAARYLESLSLLSAPLLIGRRLQPKMVLAGFAGVFVLVLLSIFWWRVFPVCFAEGRGLTPFKRSSEYIICGLLLIAMVELWRRRAALDRQVMGLLLAAMAVTLVQEFCFTLYRDPYATWNFIGHCLKIVAFYLIYLAIFETGVARPVKLLFHDLDWSRQRLELAQQAGRIGTFEWDLTSQETILVNGMENVYGEPIETMMGRYDTWRRRVHPEDLERVETLLKEVRAGKAEYHTEYRLFWPDGSVHWVEAHGKVVRDEQARPIRLIGVNIDITERKRTEEKVQRATRELERANAAKDQFIASLSHELRTPLSPALAAASAVLSDPHLPQELREDLEIIHRNVSLEVALISDLLDVTRITAGKLMLERRPVDVAQVLQNAAKISAVDLQGRRQTLTIETPGAPYPMLGDATRLHQVFWNLIKNAIKFTPEGGVIRVQAEVAAPWLRVTVSDNGIGIEPHLLSRIFNQFDQGEQGTTRQFGGLGLGLSIAKAVVEMHGGRISAHSEGKNQGARFTVELPLAEKDVLTPAEGEPGAKRTKNTQEMRLRILLVEDHADTAKLMRRLLTMQGHEVMTAGSVAEAMAAVCATEPDVLISDLGLPDGSGLDLMQQLTAQGRRLPAIALSGYGTSADIQRSKEAGFMEHLVKPLSSIETLEEVVRRLGIVRGNQGNAV